MATGYPLAMDYLKWFSSALLRRKFCFLVTQKLYWVLLYSHIILFTPIQPPRKVLHYPILQRKKLNLRKVKKLAQAHSLNRWPDWNETRQSEHKSLILLTKASISLWGRDFQELPNFTSSDPYTIKLPQKWTSELQLGIWTAFSKLSHILKALSYRSPL